MDEVDIIIVALNVRIVRQADTHLILAAAMIVVQASILRHLQLQLVEHVKHKLMLDDTFAICTTVFMSFVDL